MLLWFWSKSGKGDLSPKFIFSLNWISAKTSIITSLILKVENFLTKLEGELEILERLEEGNPTKVEDDENKDDHNWDDFRKNDDDNNDAL